MEDAKIKLDLKIRNIIISNECKNELGLNPVDGDESYCDLVIGEKFAKTVLDVIELDNAMTELKNVTSKAIDL